MMVSIPGAQAYTWHAATVRGNRPAGPLGRLLLWPTWDISGRPAVVYQDMLNSVIQYHTT